MSRIVIWGAGFYGKLAYQYYKNAVDIVFFVDSNPLLWGMEYQGKLIRNPDVLYTLDKDIQIVIALKFGYKDIQKVLYEKYCIDMSIVFGIYSEVQKYSYVMTFH